MLTWLSRRRFPYEPLITVEISKSRLIHNMKEFEKLAPGGCIAPVLKSNAYGHGLLEVARILESDTFNQKHRQGNVTIGTIPFFVVDSYFEAIALRSRHIRTPILIIGYTRPETIAIARLKHVSFTITSLEMLRVVAKSSGAERTNSGMISIDFPIVGTRHPRLIHLKIDTGMRRQGIMPHEIPEAIEIIKKCGSMVLEGICSHLCDADSADWTFTEEQIARWNRIVKQMRIAFPRVKYWHLSNTDGHRFRDEIDANVSRLGIGLYGLTVGNIFSPSLDLLPVMKMKTIITGIKQMKTNETTGYGNAFQAKKDMTIATIPAGYFEGLDRRLSNTGTILVGPNRIPCPIIGRVSMNITTVDVSNVPDAKAGMSIVAISDNQEDQNSILSIAKICRTIPYEITVKIPAQLKRVVTD